MIVLDASAAVMLLVEEDESGSLSRRLRAARTLPCAPDLIDVEVVQALRGLCLGRRMDTALAEAALTRWFSFPLRRFPMRPLLPRAWELRHNLSIYDAVYVALAEELRGTLVTHDDGLYSACLRLAELV